MKTFRTRALSIILMLAMMWTIIPLTAKAEDEYAGNAYAVLSTDGKTLYFIRSTDVKPTLETAGQTINSISGGTYTGTIYQYDETIEYNIWWTFAYEPTFFDANPYVKSNVGPGITDVVFIDNIKPISTCGMFLGFSDCTSFAGLDKLNTSDSTDFGAMFYNCSSISSLDLSSFDTSKATSFDAMFSGCNNLTTLDIDGFDASNVGYMWRMFYECNSLKSLELPSFTSTKSVEVQKMFYNCNNLSYISFGSPKRLIPNNMNNMFYGCTDLTEIDLSGFDLSTATDMSSMFEECVNLESVNLNGLSTSVAVNTNSMFKGCASLSNLDTGNTLIKSKSTINMFKGCSNLSIINMNWLDTSEVSDMQAMFSNCTNLTSLDLSCFDISKVENLSFMFYGCENLHSLNLSGWHSLKNLDAAFMFNNCKTLTDLKLMNINLKFSEINYMFADCSSLSSLDLSGFNTKNVTDMSGMFSKCSSLTDVNLSSFDTHNVTDMSRMFYGCRALTDVDLSTFDVSKLTDNGKRNMLYNTCADNTTGKPYEGLAKSDEAAEILNESSNTGINKNKLLFKHVHNIVLVETKPATCLEAGYEQHYACTGCGALYADAEGNEPIEADSIKIPITDHNYSTEWSSDKDNHWHECIVCKNQKDIAAHTPGDEATENTPQVCTTCGYVIVPALGHDMTKIDAKSPTCTAAGNSEYYICSRCGKLFTDKAGTEETTSEKVIIPATGHKTPFLWENNAEKHWRSCTECGELLESAPHTFSSWGIYKFPTRTEEGLRIRSCTICNYQETEVLPVIGIVYRYGGSNRYETSDKVAESMQFDAWRNSDGRYDVVILASGADFPDALTGSSLAASKHAPILLVNSGNMESIENFMDRKVSYDATVYILGGTGVVPESVITNLKLVSSSYRIKRLGGKNRYETNLQILKEAGVKDGDDIIVATGTNYADSLSASSTGKALVLASDSLTDEQRSFFRAHPNSKVYIIGGPAVVNEKIESQIASYQNSENIFRIFGNTRYETSILIAEIFCTSSEYAVISYGNDFPDGLCAGPLANCLSAPLILVDDRHYSLAKEFVDNWAVNYGIVSGGYAVVSDNLINIIFGDPQIKVY